MIDSISEQLEEKPWLWAVILVVVVLPLILLIVFCCSSSTPSTTSTSVSAKRKKTDEATPDAGDAPEEASTDEEEKGEEGSGDARTSASASPKKTKASLLEKKETEEADDEEVEEDKPAPVRYITCSILQQAFSASYALGIFSFLPFLEPLLASERLKRERIKHNNIHILQPHFSHISCEKLSYRSNLQQQQKSNVAFYRSVSVARNLTKATKITGTIVITCAWADGIA